MNMVIVPFMRMVALFIVVHWFPVFSICVPTDFGPAWSPLRSSTSSFESPANPGRARRCMFVPDEFCPPSVASDSRPEHPSAAGDHHVLHQMKPIQIVLHSHVESGRDRALFLVSANMQFAVGPAVGQSVDQPGYPW